MRRPFRLLAYTALLLIAATGASAIFARWWLQQPLPLPGETFTFDVKTGASLKNLARDLAAAGVLRDERALVVLARWHGVDRLIKAGNYEIPAGTTLPQLLDRLTQGDVTQTGFTLVEGATFADFKRVLAENPNIRTSVLNLPEAEIMGRLGTDAPLAEGWFFPDTYYFSSGTTDLALLQRAHRLMRARLEAAWTKRAKDLPLRDAYQALILASIVEKETGRPEDRPLVASVFINRLRIGMRLQTDPAVIYGLGDHFDGNLRKRDLETDTAYNTYTRVGLPPTPIALPGQSAIDAVLNPPRTDYLYFVSRGDGSSQFSTNLADHARAVAKFRKGGR